MTAWLEVAAGLALLIIGGEALVRGAVNLALKLGIPSLIVGLTVVAFGTSAPELLVSINAALAGQAGIAIGNVVGSNIANVLLILGIPAIITTIHSSGSNTQRSYITMIGVSLLFIALCFAGPLTWWHGLILLTALALMIWDNIRTARAHRRSIAVTDVEGADLSMRGWKIALYLIVGLAGLGLGADLLVDGATVIATAFGVSEEVIGLTLVAIGTSLPELVTTVVAAVRKQADVAMGNVIGSNIFNLLSIIGITAVISPLTVAPSFLNFDLWVMLAASLVLAPFAYFRQDIGRATGFGFVALYVAFTVYIVVGGTA